MVSLTSLASLCLVPSPYLANLRPEEELEICRSLLEAQKQAGWGFGQVRWKLLSSSNAPRAGGAAVWVKSLLLRLAVTTLWFLYLAKVPCKGRVASSSLEKRWVWQPPSIPNQKKKKNKTTPKRINKSLQDQQRWFFQNRSARVDGSSWGRVSRQGPCQAGCFPGRMWKERGEDINQLSWWQDSSILALAFTKRKLSVCGNGVCVRLVIKTPWHNPCLPVTRFSSKHEDNQESPGNQLLLALGHCELTQPFS